MYLPFEGAFCVSVAEQWKTLLPPFEAPEGFKYSAYPDTRCPSGSVYVTTTDVGVLPSAAASLVNSPPATTSQPFPRLSSAIANAVSGDWVLYGRNLYGLTSGLPTTRRPIDSPTASVRTAAFSKSRANSNADGRPYTLGTASPSAGESVGLTP